MTAQILPFDSLPRHLATQEILEIVADHTTKTHKANRARVSKALYLDDTPEAETSGLFLAVVVPGRNRLVTFKIDVVDRPDIDGIPDGRAVLRVRSKALGERLYNVPPRSTQMHTWRQIKDLQTGEMGVETFNDLWKQTMMSRDDGPERGEAGIYSEPSAVWVLPTDQLRP